MKFTIVFCLVLVVVKANLNDGHIQQQWSLFKKLFGKSYKTRLDEQRRYKIFTRNFVNILKHNKKYDEGEVPYFQGINKFADKNHEEYLKEIYCKVLPGEFEFVDSKKIFKHKRAMSEYTPDEIDWSQKGCVTKVKDQGGCGSCYAFAATGVLEAANFKLTGKLTSLSEQNIIDCSMDYGNNGCKGGMPHKAFDYIKNNNGIDSEKTYPYQNAKRICNFKRKNVGAKINSYTILNEDDEIFLKNFIAENGPVAAGINAQYESFQLYAGGIYYESNCNKNKSLTHAVLIVGYGTLNGTDYWKIKNSWGTDWGDEGYFLITRNMDNHCGIATYTVSVIADESNRINYPKETLIIYSIFLIIIFNHNYILF